MPENQLSARVAQHDTMLAELRRRVENLEDDMYDQHGVKSTLQAMRSEAKVTKAADARNLARELKWMGLMSAVIAALIGGGLRFLEAVLFHVKG